MIAVAEVLLPLHTDTSGNGVFFFVCAFLTERDFAWAEKMAYIIWTHVPHFVDAIVAETGPQLTQMLSSLLPLTNHEKKHDSCHFVFVEEETNLLNKQHKSQPVIFYQMSLL